MKYLFKASILLGACIFLLACRLASQVAPSPIAAPSSTSTRTVTPVPSRTATTTPTPTLAYNPPTLFPTFDPTSVPKLLSEAFSVQTIEDVHAHKVWQITGWDYGLRQDPCCGYQWLDSNHLLLYPRTGQQRDEFTGRSEDLSSQPVIINIENRSLWLPWSNTPTSIFFSQELGTVFQQVIYGSATGPTEEAVVIYTFDGQEVARYWGKILGVSSSGTKILVDDDTIIDLRDNKIIDLAWYMNYDLEVSSKLYWSSDETRLYRCCFYYADLRTGESYNLEWSDLRDASGKPISFSLISPHIGGQWIRNNTYFFPTWDYMSHAGDPTMIFNPAEKKYHVIELPSDPPISPETMDYTFSPDGMHVWITGFSYLDSAMQSFLVNLTTLKATSYNVPVNDFFWSADGKFGWVDGLDSPNSYVLSVTSKKLTPFPVNPRHETALWHPKDHVLAYLAKNNQSLAILNAKDMAVQGWKLPTPVSSFSWDPDGYRIVFVSTDGSLWQVDYPTFQNFEQLTEPLPSVYNVLWSPDGNSISFISGSDIYVVDAVK